MNKKQENKGRVIVYKNKVEVRLEAETVWLTLNQISDLFERDKSVVSRHLSNIFKEKELSKKSTVAKFATVQKEGKRQIVRDIECYNLDAIISVGYRVNSKRGTQFRIWATNVLRKHLVEGYTLNQKRLTKDITKYKELEKAIDSEDVEKIKSAKRLDEKYVNRMWATKSKRNTAQYRADSVIVQKDAEKIYRNAIDFVDTIETLIRGLK